MVGKLHSGYRYMNKEWWERYTVTASRQSSRARPLRRMIPVLPSQVRRDHIYRKRAESSTTRRKAQGGCQNRISIVEVYQQYTMSSEGPTKEYQSEVIPHHHRASKSASSGRYLCSIVCFMSLASWHSWPKHASLLEQHTVEHQGPSIALSTVVQA
jgi:hypothetical protein